MTKKKYQGPLCGIYRIRNTINGRVYIGQTNNLSHRWSAHKNRLRRGSHDNAHLQAAWNHYGEAAFTYEVVKPCLEADLDAEELAAIKAVAPDMIYNIAEGGGHTTRGIKFSKQRLLDHSRQRGGKTFYAVNLSNGEITVYEHTGDAKRADKGFTQSTITQCLLGRQKVHHGHSFHYDIEEAQRVASDPKAWIPQDPRSRPVIGTSLATGEQKRYEKIADVRHDHFNDSSVFRCLAGKMIQTGGFTWKYADDRAHVPMPDEWREAIAAGAARARPVEGTHIVTGEKMVFASMKDAAAHFGGVGSAIHRALSGRSRTSFRHTWCYADRRELISSAPLMVPTKKEGAEAPSHLRPEQKAQ